jgi:hypothetical protein
MDLDLEGIHVVWTYDPEAPLAAYRPWPPELTLNAVKWRVASEAERRRAVYHELGHHETQALWFWTEDPNARVNIWKAEAKAERSGLAQQISDELVQAAIYDRCELWECAERWGVDEVTAARRLRGYTRGAWGPG